jgi:copper transport protein
MVHPGGGAINLMNTRVNKITATIVAAAALLALVAAGPSLAFAEPEVTSATPADGALLAQAPEVLNLCFSEPVQTEGDGAWQFSVEPNGSTALGLRIVFATDGLCVDVFPGTPDPAPEGIWQFDWLVKAQSDSSEGSGSLLFQVGALQPGQTPLPLPDSPDAGGEDPPYALIGLIVVGVIIVILGVAGFFLRRRNA